PNIYVVSFRKEPAVARGTRADLDPEDVRPLLGIAGFDANVPLERDGEVTPRVDACHLGGPTVGTISDHQGLRFDPGRAGLDGNVIIRHGNRLYGGSLSQGGAALDRAFE